jgi:hypothetical protein
MTDADDAKTLKKELARATMRAQASEALNKELQEEIDELHEEVERLRAEAKLKEKLESAAQKVDEREEQLYPYQQEMMRLLMNQTPPWRGRARADRDYYLRDGCKARVVEDFVNNTVRLVLERSGGATFCYQLEPLFDVVSPSRLRETLLKASYELMRMAGLPENPSIAKALADEYYAKITKGERYEWR